MRRTANGLFFILALTSLLPCFGAGGLLYSLGVPTQDWQAYAGRYATQDWQAYWIAPNQDDGQDFGVHHFRRRFELDQVPADYLVHVSADNRYELLVNGQLATRGPARGDTNHWRFETVDLAPLLRTGFNLVTAVVWNFGEDRPVAQFSRRTAFILQGETDTTLNTGDGEWRVMSNGAYAPLTEPIRALHTYHVVGPGEIVDGSKYPWGWEMEETDGDWSVAQKLTIGRVVGSGAQDGWQLEPRQIPPMESYPLPAPVLRKVEGMDIDSGWPGGPAPLIIPPNSEVTLWLDQGELTNAYPTFTLSDGAGSRVEVTYAESLYLEESGNAKGHRAEVEGKYLRGNVDRWLPDGGDNRSFRPLWWRTYRYLQLHITTAGEPLQLLPPTATYTGYPFERKARIRADQTWLDSLREVGWRTARLCAGETYFDCPYYEQLQYTGDTRIQALISLYETGDDRLMRRAILDFEQSLLPSGLTQSRYPSRVQQIIQPYSLFLVAMVHDYWMHVPDTAFVAQRLPVLRSILDWYEERRKDNGMLEYLLQWPYVDWVPHWNKQPGRDHGGVPPEDSTGNSSIQALQYAYALGYAAELHRAFGASDHADRYTRHREETLAAVVEECWDAERGLLRDHPSTPVFSQHANVLAVLTDALPPAEVQPVMERVLADTSLTQATFYFKFYLFQAMQRVGMADRYLDQLKPWRDMLDMGLTTFAEKPDPTRSDCHAWSASPNYDLLATVAGIRPAAPGFVEVSIEPALGALRELRGSLPHPRGSIDFEFERDRDDRVVGRIKLPPGVRGEYRAERGSFIFDGGEWWALPTAPREYITDPDWPAITTREKMGQPVGVDRMSDGTLMVFHRGLEAPDPQLEEAPVFRLDPATGEIIDAWGEGVFVKPHGLYIDAQDNVWLTDIGSHQVFKFSSAGKLLLTLGEAGVKGKDESHFDQPTDIAIAADGSTFVSDGYGNRRIVKFDATGKYLLEWGQEGGAPGEFVNPHGLDIGPDGRLYVSDRENSRLQVFDQMGKFIEQRAAAAPLYACKIDPATGDLIATDYDFTRARPHGSVVFSWSLPDYHPTPFFGRGSYVARRFHDLAKDEAGNIYTADLLTKRIWRFLPK